ncbi:hypothetical protein OCS_00220 [Ophiocordyceps sinensis CO18]|uniref:Uncharacterized protein n=1 Tax=Ophiocordyceps sinensis (strain Co18 / CGMCC 3.14243) TaxID=911162 RepID=T5AF34_OPHSC|nr:hypothetical protein OCS_00220 [Ophiocordyceps sinensis CO18]
MAASEDNDRIFDTSPEMQCWTQSGHPIVDGRYLDQNGTVREVEPNEWTVAGPPALDVYWSNRKVTLDLDYSQFRAIASSAFVDVTEYLARVGELPRATAGSCEIIALNATLYSVNVIVGTDLSQGAMRDLLFEHRLAPAH